MGHALCSLQSDAKNGPSTASGLQSGLQVVKLHAILGCWVSNCCDHRDFAHKKQGHSMRRATVAPPSCGQGKMQSKVESGMNDRQCNSSPWQQAEDVEVGDGIGTRLSTKEFDRTGPLPQFSFNPLGRLHNVEYSLSCYLL